MSDARRRVADRLAREIADHIAEICPGGAGALDETWKRTEESGASLDDAMIAFERGEISYPMLEAAGLVYVEAWASLVGTT